MATEFQLLRSCIGLHTRAFQITNSLFIVMKVDIIDAKMINL
jgi:hypothetical protein